MSPAPAAQELGAVGLWALYAVLFAAAFCKYVVPFVPGDLATLIALFAIGLRSGSWTFGALAVTTGGTLGAYVAYAGGDKVGRYLISRSARLQKVQVRVERALKRWGFWPLVLNRFVPYIRPLLFPAAGALKMRPLPVLASAFAGNLLFALFLVGIAYTAGHRFSHLQNLYQLYQLWIGLAVFLLLAALGFRFWRKLKKNGGGEE